MCYGCFVSFAAVLHTTWCLRILVRQSPITPWTFISRHLLFYHKGGKEKRDINQPRLASPLFLVLESASLYLHQFGIKLGKCGNCVAAGSLRPDRRAWKYVPCILNTEWYFFFLSFNWTRASCNRITPAIADRPARTFLYMCVRARAFIDWEQSQVIPSLFYDKQSTWRHCIRDWPARSTRTNPSPTLQRRATSSGKVWKGRVRRRANEPGFSSTAGAARTRM